MNRLEFDMACYVQAIPDLKEGVLKRFLMDIAINHYFNLDESYMLYDDFAIDFQDKYKMPLPLKTTPADYFTMHKEEIIARLKIIEAKEC